MKKNNSGEVVNMDRNIRGEILAEIIGKKENLRDAKNILIENTAKWMEKTMLEKGYSADLIQAIISFPLWQEYARLLLVTEQAEIGQLALEFLRAKNQKIKK